MPEFASKQKQKEWEARWGQAAIDKKYGKKEAKTGRYEDTVPVENVNTPTVTAGLPDGCLPRTGKKEEVGRRRRRRRG